MKMDPVERILRCLDGEILDRVPHMELGFNIYPSVQLNLYFDRLPPRMKNWILNLGIYENAVQTAKEHLGFSDPIPRTLTRRLLHLDRLTTGLISFPTSLQFMDAFNPFLFRIPLRLGIDMIPCMGYPSIIVRGKVRRRNSRFYVSEDWALIDVDDIGDIRSVEPFFEPEMQMEKLIDAYKTDPLIDKINYVGGLQKSIQGKLALAPILNGIMESWHIVWGMSNMHLFFRHFIKEYRKGPPYGIYKRFLQEKSKFYAKYMKMLGEETEIRFAAIVEDCAEDNGPFLPAEQYKNFFVPEIKRIVDAAHKVGIKVLFHTDGRFKVRNSDKPWDFLDAILSTGVDMLHGCQQDCNNLRELKEYVDNKVTLVGGVSCVGVLQHAKSARQLYRLAGSAIETLKQGGHYIVAADNAWHAGVKMENIRWYLNAVKHYGKY
ncbi:MAG: hypothetical protein EU536_01500 [Promethearchaeota archaeon]|nr:MAG: hypothetical protein EU536_01500 [Candidatus Lokiarchaeota archaeon]